MNTYIVLFANPQIPIARGELLADQPEGWSWEGPRPFSWPTMAIDGLHVSNREDQVRSWARQAQGMDW